MRITRKTALAGAAMSVASLVSATLAVAATMDLPLLGFGSSSSALTTTETVADTDVIATTPTAVPLVVEQVIYEDVYERVARPTAPRVAAAADPAPTTAAPAPTQPPLPTTTVATTTRSTTTTAPTTTQPATTTTRVTTTRPAPPPNCEEPEWDREHQRWHCKGD